MEKDNNALKSLNNISKEYVDNVYNLRKQYLDLVKNYSGYTFNQILMFYKIERLLERNLITEDDYYYLTKLMQEKRRLESVIAFTDKEDLSYVYYEELNKINSELLVYNINLSLEDLIDSTIDEELFKSVKPAITYYKRPKHY